MNEITKTIALLLTAAATIGASAPEPDARRMASVAYHVPMATIDAGLNAIGHNMDIAGSDRDRALATLVTCAKTGAVQFPELIASMPDLTQEWRVAYRRPDVARTFGLRVDGLADLSRLCGAIETVRRGHGDDASTIAAVKLALTGRDGAASTARAMIHASPAVVTYDVGAIRKDYRLRLAYSRP